MITDSIEHFAKYVALHPLFVQVHEFIQKHDLTKLPDGKTMLADGLTVSVSQTKPKSKEQARLEAHKLYIDIQIPLSDTEIMGYQPLTDCTPADAVYNADKDIVFFDGPASSYLALHPGMFAIFFPQDAHAPAITACGVKKIVFKIRIED